MTTLIPAYGRDYKSQREVTAAWDARKDFLIAGIDADAGRYTSKGDWSGNEVTIRYDRLRKSIVVKG